MSATSTSQVPYAMLAAAAGGMTSEPASETADDIAQMAIEVCRFARAQNRKAEKEFRSWMAIGTTGEVLRNTMGKDLERTEADVKEFQEIRSRFGPISAYDHAPSLREVFIVEFSAFVDEAAAFAKLVRSLVDLASAPRTIPDPERLRASQDAFANGELKLVSPGFLTRRRSS